MNLMDQNNYENESFLVYHQEGQGFIGIDGTRFARVAYWNSPFGHHVAHFNNIQAVRNYLTEVGVSYDPKGLRACAGVKVSYAITERDWENWEGEHDEFKFST